MEDCIFCKIVKGEIPSFKVYEDENTVAFLDLMPRSRGMCLIVPKNHYTFFEENFDASSNTFAAALIVAEKIRVSMQPLAVFFSAIQSQVPHFHVRVYPVYQDQIPLIENKPIETNEGELKSLADMISDVKVEWRPKEKIVEIIKEVRVEKEKPKEESGDKGHFWKPRHMEVA